MFSPYYAHARRRGGVARPADPHDHCALNVVLYRRSGSSGPKRWAMTERGRGALQRDRIRLRIGPSALRWDSDGTLRIDIDERSMPFGARVRGTVRVRPAGLHHHAHTLDAHGRHRWTPIAPVATVEVKLDRPALHWRGPGYLDSNHGDAALEADFSHWNWSRAALPDGRTAVLYDAVRRDASSAALALAFGPGGTVEAFEPPPIQAVAAGLWGVARSTRCDAGHTASLRQALEDGPFYTRSLLATHLFSVPVTALHESLSLQRFEQRWVQAMLPFRMPRMAR